MQRSETADRVAVPARVLDDHGDELVVEINSLGGVVRMFVPRKDVKPMEKAA